MYEILLKIIADGLVVVLGLVLFFSFLKYVPKDQKIEKGTILIISGLTSYFVAKCMSFIPVDVHRPFELMGVAPKVSYMDNPGFPSDHSLFVWVMVFALMYFLPKSKWWIVYVSIGFAILVGIGRVAGLVHTWLDIAGGFVAAAAGAVWYIFILKMSAKEITKKQSVKKHKLHAE